MDSHDAIKRTQLQPGRHIWFARIPFALTAIGGGALLVAMKALNIDQLYVTGVAITFIICYAITVSGNPVLRLREDQLADNCYYLGFLYTLFSVAWALHEFAQSGNESAIIANFGLALGSTIAGVLLRVILNQARKDVIETEADARMELTEAVVRLRVQIDDAVLALRSFCKQTEQIAADAIRASSDRATAALDQNTTKINQTASSVISGIDTVFAKFSGHSSELTSSVSATVKAVKSLLSRIEKIEAPSDLLTKRLEPALATVDAAVERVRQRMDQEQSVLNELSRRGGDLKENLRQTADQVAALVRSLSGATADLGRVTSAAVSAINNLGAFGTSLDTAIAEHARILAAIKGATEGFSNALVQEREAAINNAREGLSALLEALRNHNESIARELERSRRMTADVGNAFADLAEAVTARARTTPISPIPIVASRT